MDADGRNEGVFMEGLYHEKEIARKMVERAEAMAKVLHFLSCTSYTSLICLHFNARIEPRRSVGEREALLACY